MSEAVTALNGAGYDEMGTVIRDAGLTGMITLRGDLASAAVAQAVAKVTGLPLPAPRKGSFGAARSVLWMSPDELLILGPYSAVTADVAALTAALKGQHALVADVSDARAMFVLTGERVRDVFARLTPADIHPASLPVGEVRRTRFAQVPAALWMAGAGQAQVICFRSVAQYMLGVLTTAAQSAGS